jgi:hypothetical protein
MRNTRISKDYQVILFLVVSQLRLFTVETNQIASGVESLPLLTYLLLSLNHIPDSHCASTMQDVEIQQDYALKETWQALRMLTTPLPLIVDAQPPYLS